MARYAGFLRHLNAPKLIKHDTRTYSLSCVYCERGEWTRVVVGEYICWDVRPQKVIFFKSQASIPLKKCNSFILVLKFSSASRFQHDGFTFLLCTENEAARFIFLVLIKIFGSLSATGCTAIEFLVPHFYVDWSYPILLVFLSVSKSMLCAWHVLFK